MKKLLVAYYTETNTTKEIAEAIGRTAAKNEWECDIKALSDISSVKDYDAVLIGAPVHAMRWVPEANTFVKKKSGNTSENSDSFLCGCLPAESQPATISETHPKKP